ncbi:hypothetical protein IPdc08_00049 [archaeon]|nr:hypothetical protein IPdc08_00049 [archaeon]
MMSETIELTDEEMSLIDKLSGMLELSEERFYVVIEGDKKSITDVFEAIYELRKESVKAVEVETRAGVVVVVDKNFNICFCDRYVLSDSLCKFPCSRILSDHPCNHLKKEASANNQ